MATIHIDDMNTVHVAGALTSDAVMDLTRAVGDALLVSGPAGTLTLSFADGVSLSPSAVDALRGALLEMVALCSDHDVRLTLLPTPALRAVGLLRV